MFARQITFFLAPAICSFALLGCAGNSSEPPNKTLAPWNGSWRAIETYMRSSAFEPVAEAIREQRPEYTAQEIKEIFSAGHDVDFTDLDVTDDSLTFMAEDGVVCAGKYALGASHAEGHDHDGGAAHDHHGATFTFDLLEVRGGDCSAYGTVAFGSYPEVASDAEGAYAHFHLQAGTPRPAPWSPGVVTPIAPDRFTETQLANASAYAQGLPPKE
jgi:Zn/Cd-binding protein ZinT